MAVSLVSTGVTFPDNSTQTTAATGFGFKNRIINGAMVIDQRNAGAEVNPAVNSTYYLDRWFVNSSAASKFKIGQNAGGLTGTNLPVGFTNYLGCTSLSSYSVGSSESFIVRQYIEGFNTADLSWGTANAATVTLSFWVRSSLTGTFGGSLKNSAGDRSYPFSYTISSANTWEQKSITIAGDTSGTWIGATNGIGIAITFSIGVGSTLSGTAGAWAGVNYNSATGATSVVGTNGATFYITGVQLEKGSTATSFDYRPYGTELALCQRYYYKTKSTALVTSFSVGFVESTTVANGNMVFPVSLRTSPTAIEQSGTAGDYAIRYVSTDATCSAVPYFVAANVDASWFRFPVASGLTAGQAVMLRALNTSAYLAWSAEL